MKSLFPVLSILLGIFFSQVHSGSFLIKYLLMFILFFPFLGMKLSHFYYSTLWIVLANITIAVTCYLLIFPLNPELAFICFITAITPTATAAPAITSFLKGNVEYVTFSVLVTNSIIALTIPFIIPHLIDPSQSIATQEILISVLFLFSTPLVIAQALKSLIPQIVPSFLNYKNLSFYAWNIMLILASAKATHFILHEATTPPRVILLIALSSLILCIINFNVGRVIGGKAFAQEASQSLGQKNTMFTVWLSLSFLPPIVALGPMFYLIYHNLYNSYLLMQMKAKSS